MQSSTPVSHLLAEFAAAARYDHLPPQIVHETQRAVLDWLGSALAGALEPPARTAQQIVVLFGAADEATIFGAGRAAAASAALANGIASHILELDDVHKGSTLHAAAPIIPAALAVAERGHVTGKAFLLAVALGYEALQETHPRLIWCGISGYGPDGPYCDKKAYDLLVQAEAGLVSLTGSADAPAKVGISIADIGAGLYGYSSILAALLNRERTGRGERIDISMLECLTEWASPHSTCGKARGAFRRARVYATI